MHGAPRQLAHHDEADNLQRALQRPQHQQHEYARRHVSGLWTVGSISNFIDIEKR